MLSLFRNIRRGLRWLWRGVKWSIGLTLFLIVIQRSTYPLTTQWNAVATTVGDHLFDYVQWEIGALASKTAQTLWGVHPFMDEDTRSQTVRDYMAELARARDLEAQITAIYTDPNISNPDAESADLQAERDALRDDLSLRQSLVEAILEGQVASVLVDEGFETFGQLLPPIAMHFTQVPNLLIVSPRDEIRFEVSINIDPLPIDEITELEAQIDSEQDVSSLIVPLGGIALYPAMILETTNIAWAVETFAHEWVHHYFFFFPLGLNYFTGEDFAGDARIINETVADLFGKAIRDLVLARYYPELIAESTDTVFASPLTSHLPIDAPDYGVLEGANQPVTFAPELLSIEASEALLQEDEPFDFGFEMNETRVTVDAYMHSIQLLQARADREHEIGHVSLAEGLEAFADGLVLQVEQYMEGRRQVFFDNGYRIRKINQAYFAFYGGYQGGIAGIGGEDPIGPAVRDILAFTPDIQSFIVTMRGITSKDELLAVRDALAGE